MVIEEAVVCGTVELYCKYSERCFNYFVHPYGIMDKIWKAPLSVTQHNSTAETTAFLNGHKAELTSF